MGLNDYIDLGLQVFKITKGWMLRLIITINILQKPKWIQYPQYSITRKLDNKDDCY